MDKYGRQLGITAGKVDQLLEEESLAEFVEILLQHFPDQEHAIDEFLSNVRKLPGA